MSCDTSFVLEEQVQVLYKTRSYKGRIGEIFPFYMENGIKYGEEESQLSFLYCCV